jgi:hypothetical protein
LYMHLLFPMCDACLVLCIRADLITLTKWVINYEASRHVVFSICLPHLSLIQIWLSNYVAHIIKSSRAISRVKWFKHEQTNVSRSISVLSSLDLETLVSSCLNHSW